MPVDSTASAEVTAFRWVPDFAQGLVRDLRVRWALEEIERPYRVRLLDATTRGRRNISSSSRSARFPPIATTRSSCSRAARS